MQQFPIPPVVRGSCAGLLLVLLLAFGVSPRATSAPVASGLAQLGGIPAQIDCSALAREDLTVAVGAATRILAASVKPSRVGAFCVVRGTIAPSIGFEVQLPVKGWTQRYLQTGCGGLCGVLQVRVDHAEQCQPYQNGQLAIASTDMGHEGATMGDGDFGGDPQLRIDFAYRGVHLTALAAKALISRYYGRGPRYSYFSGCSDGGREALMEAQRFPDDFDGIAAGAPAMNFQVQNSFYHAWMARSNTDAHGRAILTANKLPMLHAAVLAACDALDGLKDGQITNPRNCHFDPANIECKPDAANTSTCLTAAQVETVRRFYAGPHDAYGHRFVVGSVQPGSELQWRGVFVPATADGPIMSADIATQSLRHLIFANNPPATYTLADFKFDTATFAKLAPMHALYDATNPDLDGFIAHHGKLLLWHGWADPHISPLNTIAYYQAVEHRSGASTGNSVRLFLFPGMGHCGGGDGPDQFDILTPLMAWVESGHAPQRIIAGRPISPPHSLPPMPPPGGRARSAGPPPPSLDPVLPSPVNRTRPVFPYPAVARYTGKGDINQAANFVATRPAHVEPAPAWMGSSFYSSGFQKPCVAADGRVSCH